MRIVGEIIWIVGKIGCYGVRCVVSGEVIGVGGYECGGCGWWG